MKAKSLLRDSLSSVGRNTWYALLALCLGLLLLADRFYPSYRDRLEARDDAVLRAERAQALADVLPTFQAKLNAGNGTFQQLSSQSYLNADVQQSSQQFRDEVALAIQAARIPQPVSLTVQSDPVGQSAILTLLAQFQALPHQLSDLEIRLLSYPRLMRVSAISVQVVPDTLTGGRQLAVSMTVKALHATATAPAQ
jgi:hypothetical protein